MEDSKFKVRNAVNMKDLEMLLNDREFASYAARAITVLQSQSDGPLIVVFEKQDES